MHEHWEWGFESESQVAIALMLPQAIRRIATVGAKILTHVPGVDSRGAKQPYLVVYDGIVSAEGLPGALAASMLESYVEQVPSCSLSLLGYQLVEKLDAVYMVWDDHIRLTRLRTMLHRLLGEYVQAYGPPETFTPFMYIGQGLKAHREPFAFEMLTREETRPVGMSIGHIVPSGAFEPIICATLARPVAYKVKAPGVLIRQSDDDVYA